jgi:YggT family protein
MSMLYQIVYLLLDVTVGLVAGMCVLRAYMQFQRIPMSVRAGNPAGPFIFALSDWIVLPLRRVLPRTAAVDLASVLAAFVLELAQFGVLWLLQGAQGDGLSVPVMAFFGVLRLVVSGLTGLVLLYALLSWVQVHSAATDLLDRLVAPPLTPIRRHLPLVGGVDLSPLALLLILQIANMMMITVQAWVLAWVT